MSDARPLAPARSWSVLRAASRTALNSDLSVDFSIQTMWCSNCQQDVPATGQPGTNRSICSRCQQIVRPPHAVQICEAGIALDENPRIASATVAPARNDLPAVRDRRLGHSPPQSRARPQAPPRSRPAAHTLDRVPDHCRFQSIAARQSFRRRPARRGANAIRTDQHRPNAATQAVATRRRRPIPSLARRAQWGLRTRHRPGHRKLVAFRGPRRRLESSPRPHADRPRLS